ncbi:hypothetical protein IT575_03600 [bacterium]|nr:hypothetical protein [bacterium]
MSACSVSENLEERGSSAFRLELLPGSFDFGGSADIRLSQREEAGEILLDVHAYNAHSLRALYFELYYDPTQFSPLSVSATDELAPAAQRLELNLSGQAGLVQHGQLLLHPQIDMQPGSTRGFNGSGVLATLRFERRPFSAGRAVSTPPSGANSNAVLGSGGLSGTLLWYYFSPGDYDQNGIVAVQDLTPIGINFGASVAAGPGPDGRDFKTALHAIDGSSDGVINVQDLTAIGVNFGRQVNKYTIYEAPDSSAYPASDTAPSSISLLDSVLFSTAIGNPVSERKQFFFSIPAPVPGSVYWVRPADASDMEGAPSNVYDPALAGSNNISGTILEDTSVPIDGIGDVPLAGVTVTLGGGVATTTTAGDGSYSFSGVGDNTYTVTPSLSGYSFTPINRTIAVPPDAGSTDFVGNPGAANQPPTILGVIATPQPARPGQTVSLYADGADPDGDPLTYTWQVISGGGSLIHSITSPTPYNGYTSFGEESVEIRVTLDDGRGGSIDTTQPLTISNAAPEGSWHVFDVDLGGSGTNNTGVRSSLIEVNGLPRILYYRQDSVTGDGVYEALTESPFGEVWTTQVPGGNAPSGPIPGGFGGLSALYAPRSAPVDVLVAAYDDTGMAPSPLAYSLYPATGGGWSTSGLDSDAGAGIGVDGVLDALGQPLYAYHCEQGLSTGSLRALGADDYQTNMWRFFTGIEGEPEAPGVDVGSDCSINIIGGFPAVAYYDKANAALKFAGAFNSVGSDWTTPPAVLPITVDASPGLDFGRGAQLVTESDGTPGIFYFNATDSTVLYARASSPDGSAWGGGFFSVDSGDSLRGMSAGQSPAGDPAAVYFNASSGNLVYDEITGFSPYTSNNLPIASSPGVVYGNPSYALVGGRAAVSFYDFTNQSLKYAVLY